MLLEQETEGPVGGEEVRKEVGVISCLRPVSHDRLQSCHSAAWVARAGLRPVLCGSCRTDQGGPGASLTGHVRTDRGAGDGGRFVF